MSRTVILIAAVLLPLAGARADESNAEYDQYCVGCHGGDARGLQNSGVDLVDSGFVAQSSEEALVEFLKNGRLPDDPANKTGRPMPGFSWVTDGELRSIAAFLKSRGKPL